MFSRRYVDLCDTYINIGDVPIEWKKGVTKFNLRMDVNLSLTARLIKSPGNYTRDSRPFMSLENSTSKRIR